MIYIITGQTATGKTKLALEYAKKYDGELVNFDSRQIYKYLNIITGKDIPSTKIWLYNIVTPDKYFSSFDYVSAANKIITDIVKRGKTPILVGGSYFYLKHLLYGFDNKVPPNFELREKLNKKSVQELQKLLKKIDSKTFRSMNNSDKNNPRRLIRKIEIHNYVSKFNGSKSLKATPSNLKTLKHSNFKILGLKYKNKENLTAAIKFRVNKRLKDGAIKEVESLLKKGYKPTDPGLKTIGYQQLIKYLKGNLPEKQAIEEWVTREVQYAKRQYTFMKKDKNIKWMEI